jgi:protein O-GlcNAc transferase
MIVASRIALIQITWLTFASCTTGLETVDYRISDPYLDPPEPTFAEKTLYLPETAWCYDPLLDSPPVKPLPALTNGFITFGSLNRFSKINPIVVSAWSEILRSVPISRLHILAIPGNHRQWLLVQFQNLGIDPRRIEFIDRRSRLEYMQQYDRIDITLDPFPFSGHTTALDSLWMGVPVVTLSGRTSVGRAACSALHNLGLPELIAQTPQEYVSIAVRLSQDAAGLSKLRADLRPRMQKSALTDGSRFANEMQKLYRQICTERRIN